MALSNRDRVAQAVRADGALLSAHFTTHVEKVLPKGMDWLELVAQRDRSSGMTKDYSPQNPALLLRMVADNIPPRRRTGQ
jgi:hypothetical protein